ncbi:MAG: hypothetical protein LRY67_02005 [Gammaproteobacteria bacterium]|nr:hypothetical protein [Gammaproteobacteria bacterium]MCD8543218.1 hypothetical protein [Gammaproteobacteria bacterium]
MKPFSNTLPAKSEPMSHTLYAEITTPLANSVAPLSNRYQIAATSDNTRRAYHAFCGRTPIFVG